MPVPIETEDVLGGVACTGISAATEMLVNTVKQTNNKKRHHTEHLHPGVASPQ